jgi:hypothetical protein
VFVDRLPPFERGQPVWHVSTTVYGVGDSIGPHPGDSPHWANTRTNAWWCAHEDVFERLRPAGLVSRRTCLFATDSPVQIGRMIKARPGARAYRVSVPAQAEVSGRFDLQLVNIKIEAAPAAQRYWAGEWLDVRDVRPEILATELVVEAVMDVAFHEAVRRSGERDLTMLELERGQVSS